MNGEVAGMASREVIKERLSFYKRKYAALQEAQLALIEGRGEVVYN